MTKMHHYFILLYCKYIHIYIQFVDYKAIQPDGNCLMKRILTHNDLEGILS